MKALFLFLCSLFVFQEITAQRAVVANLKKNRVDIGYPNPLDILVEGYKCSEFEVSTDNGIITKEETNCNYNYVPERSGNSQIIISKKTGKVISRINLTAEFIRLPVSASIGGKESGPVNIDSNGVLYIYDLLSWDQVDANINGLDWDAEFRVKKYSVAITILGDSTFLQMDIIGNIFTKELKESFKKVKHGSKLIFYGITAQGPDKRILELSPMEFTITKK